MAPKGKKDFEVAVDMNGRGVVGRGRYDDGIVTVTFEGREKATQLGGLPLDTLAKQLLRELAG